ncbi:MAG: lipoxygenase y protein 1 [Cryptosporangiaceae bacterium]|nr:lipoxygenase y protein 1 [Cryptosporangiaceae bacterium]
MNLRLAAAAVVATGALVAVPSAAFAQTTHATAAHAAVVSPRAAQAYTVNVHTSNLDGAGTDATVEVRIHGSKGTSGWLNLDNASDNFERNDYDSFTFYLTDLGTLDYTELYFNDGGDDSDWSLDYVSVSSATGYAFYPYYNWLRNAGTTALHKA